MKVSKTDLPGILIIEPKVYKDDRGFFLETFHEKRYQEAGVTGRFVQDNHSKSVKNTLRGLHAQLTQPQGKLIRVLHGEIFDVAVDIRVGSPTFGKWVGQTLSAENHKQIYVPIGYAHGFCVVSDMAEVEYKCTDFYNPQGEVGLLWNDKTVGIRWPVGQPLLSQKDKAGKTLDELKEPLSRTPGFHTQTSNILPS